MQMRDILGIFFTDDQFVENLSDRQAAETMRHLEAVKILRQIWLQQFVFIEGDLRQRRREDMPPAAQII